MNEPGRQKLGQWNPCKQAQHAKLYTDLVISASAVPHHGEEKKKFRRKTSRRRKKKKEIA